MATIRNRGRGVWQVQVYLGTDPATGKKRRTARTVHGTRRDAEQVARDLETARRTIRPNTRITIPELVKRRIDARSDDWSPKTTAEARRRLRLHHAPAKLPAVADVRAHHIEAWYARLRSNLGPATVRKLHDDLTAALNQAVRWDLINTNPAHRVDPPPTTPHPKTGPTAAQVRQLIATAEPPWLATWLRVAAVTGHRAGTLAALRWTDINLDQRTVTFARAVTRGDQGLVEKTTKADRTDRVTLDPHTTAAIAAHWARMTERALAVGRHLPADAFVWSRHPASDRPYDPGAVSHAFTRLRRYLDLPDGITLHTLRHYAVTTMLTAGIPAPVVADRVGATTRVIEDVYRHHLPGQDQAAADLMAGTLDQ